MPSRSRTAHRAFKPSLLATAVALALLPALPAAAQQNSSQANARAVASQTHAFSIPAKPLPQAITDFSSVTGVQVLYTGDQAYEISAPAVRGNLTTTQALERLLAGSGITYRFTGERSVTLAQRSAQQITETTQLDAIQITADRTGGPVEGFRAERSSSATNVDAPLIETPATANVVTRDFLDTIAARRPEDAFQYVPGVGTAAGIGSSPGEITIRGFEMDPMTDRGNTGVYVDGFVAPGRRYHFDSALYERVEVLKGASSLLYGTAQPGGVVRYVTKKPEFESRYRVEGSVGSFDTARTTFDATGPLSEDKSVAYRLIVSGFTGNQTLHGRSDDRSDDDRVLVAPSLTWLAPTGGELNLRYEYSKQGGTLDPGIKRRNDGSYTWRSQPFIGPDSFSEREHQIGVAEYTHPLGEDWEAYLGGKIVRSDIEILWDFATNDPNAAGMLDRFSQRLDEEQEQEELRAELRGGFSTGANIDHQLTVGVRHFEAENVRYNMGRNFQQDEVDIENPVFGPAPIPPMAATLQSAFPGENLSAYVQDYVTMYEKLKIFGGVRFMDVESTLNVPGAFVRKGEDEVLDYTLGAVYNRNHWLNPFVSYSTATNPQIGELFSGGAVEFSESEQFEIGNKSEWFDGRLATTMSVFQIEQTNIVEGDALNPGFFILSGDQRTRGFELEAVGEVTDRASLLGGYSYLDAEFTESTTGNEGNTPANVPKHKLSLFAEYAFAGDLTGWSTGAGVVHVGERQADTANTFESPTYERIDLTLAYDQGPFDFRATVENLLDEDYIEGVRNGNRHVQGATRFITLAAGYEF